MASPNIDRLLNDMVKARLIQKNQLKNCDIESPNRKRTYYRWCRIGASDVILSYNDLYEKYQNLCGDVKVYMDLLDWSGQFLHERALIDEFISVFEEEDLCSYLTEEALWDDRIICNPIFNQDIINFID